MTDDKFCPKMTVLGKIFTMFDGLTEATIERRVRKNAINPLCIVSAVATPDMYGKKWKVTLMYKEGNCDVSKEALIEEKRGGVKEYSSLNRLAVRLAKIGVKSFVIDLTSLQ